MITPIVIAVEASQRRLDLTVWIMGCPLNHMYIYRLEDKTVNSCLRTVYHEDDILRLVSVHSLAGKDKECPN